MKPQVESAHYFQENYLTIARFISYYYQVDFIRNTGAQKILFIGVGDGMVPTMLKKNREYDVTTLDIDADLCPDVIADIQTVDFPDDSFDLVCAFEVLEHMPIAESERALANMARISKKHVIVSVPHRRTGFELVLKFPGIRTVLKKDFVKLALLFPLRFKGFAESGQHYWEIDGHSTPLEKFRSILRKNFTIMSELTPVLDSYHRFFDLRKK